MDAWTFFVTADVGTSKTHLGYDARSLPCQAATKAIVLRKPVLNIPNFLPNVVAGMPACEVS